MLLRWLEACSRCGFRTVQKFSRRYSSVSSTRVERVTIPCRSNGNITLDIHHPLSSPQPGPLVIHLPSGPVDHGLIDTNSAVSALSASAAATVVNINYRLDSLNRYPTPVHDVLAGYDWVLEHLAPYSATPTRYGRHNTRNARIGVYGRLVGGSLATMLALTECRLGEARISAASVGDAILDWVAFGEPIEDVIGEEIDDDGVPEFDDEEDWRQLFGRTSYRSWEEGIGLEPPQAPTPERLPDPVRNRRNAQDLTQPLLVSDLLRARATFFGKPPNYFDRFASPIHFFRTPVADMPCESPMSIDFGHEFHFEAGNDLEESRSVTEPEESEQRRPRRKYSLRYPPSGSGLRLPRFDISVAAESILQEQNIELAKYLRRSFIRTLSKIQQDEYIVELETEERSRELDTKAVMEAERRVNLRIVERGKHADEASSEIERAGLWMRGALQNV